MNVVMALTRNALPMIPPMNTQVGSGVPRARLSRPASRRNGRLIARFTRHDDIRPKATMFGVKNWSNGTPPREPIRSPLLSDPRTTRNRIGKANVNTALAGLRQNRFCSISSWSSTSRQGLMPAVR